MDAKITDIVSPLKLARLRAGLSQDALARRAGRARALISAAERGALSRPLAEHLAKILGTTAAALLGSAR